MAGPTDMLQVEVLGPVRAWHGATEIRLGPTRQRALFTVLAFRHDQVVSREELINAVWGHEAPATAEGSVHTYVSGLRRALEPNRSKRGDSTVLLSDGAGYRLRLDPEAFDAAKFHALRGKAHEARTRGAAGEAIELADRALALWHGDPLPGLPGPFAATCRDELAAARLSLLETRAAAGLAHGRHAELVAELTTLITRSPLHEGLRGLLMIALYRCGRQADALEEFRQARQALAAELDAHPGQELVRIHQQILTNDPALAAPVPEPATAPAPRARWSTVPRPRAPFFVNRQAERKRLRDAVSSLTAGRGHVVWLEGEPGIGKSELLATTLADLDSSAFQVCWGSGDELAQRFPLRVMLECLGVDPESPDPRRARVAGTALCGSVQRDLLGGGCTTVAAVDGLVELVLELCADGPLAVVVDDLHWADEDSLLVWNRLAHATHRLPLLLFGASRPLPRTAVLDRLRETVVRQGGTTLRLDRLPDSEVDELVGGIVGAPPGPGLRRLTSRAAGNPLYVQELAEALVRDEVVRISAGTADMPTSASAEAPVSLASALANRLGFLTPATSDVLRHATLLGTDFGISDLSIILARLPSDLLPAIVEATTSGVLVAGSGLLAFRHPLIRQALYDGMAPAVRAALHRYAAESLDRSGASTDAVARQLAAASLTADAWTVRWVLANGEQIAAWAPDIALDLLRRVITGCDPTDPRLEDLTASLARIMYWLGGTPEAETRAVLATTVDPDLAGEMQWILACVYYRRGTVQRAVDALRVATSAPDVSLMWRARCRALLAGHLRVGAGTREEAEITVRVAVAEAEQAGDVFAKAFALQTLWLSRAIDRDHAEGLRFVDEALDVLADTPGAHLDLTPLQLSLLDNRVFSLQNLDRLPEADATLTTAEHLVRRYRLPAGLSVPTAVNHFWAGRWDQALAELSAVVDARTLDIAFHGLRESGPMLLLLHGVAALIAAFRDDDARMTAHLAAADDLPLITSSDRDACDFLLMADALAAERAGQPEAALVAFGPVLDERYSPMMLRHQWLPDAARIALRINRTDIATRALEMCAIEARKEVRPARAVAAEAHCRGLVLGEPEPVLAAARHYQDVGRPLELARALEDAAALLAGAGQEERARDMLARAVHHYDELGAVWAIRRATARLLR